MFPRRRYIRIMLDEVRPFDAILYRYEIRPRQLGAQQSQVVSASFRPIRFKSLEVLRKYFPAHLS